MRFRRCDLPGSPTVRATIDHVVDTRRGTSIAQEQATIHTVEHLLAAFNALGVDNVLVEMSGPEPPVMDGSSKPFVDLIQEAGVEEQDATRSFIDVTETVVLESGETKMIVIPDDAFRVSCTVKFDETVLDCQYLSLEITGESFVNALCEARTFCRYYEIEPLMAANLIRGGSLDNAVVLKDGVIFSKDGLRYPDELVRHKILDIVGDLYLLGRRIRGQVIAIRPGHPANVALARKIAELAGADV